MSQETAFIPQIKVTWLIGILAAIALFAVIASYSLRMTRTYSDFDQQRAAQRYATLKQVREDADKVLTTAAWVDQSKGIVRIPIEEAMTKEIDTLKAESAHLCPPPETGPAPAPVPAATAAPTSPAPAPAKAQK